MEAVVPTKWIDEQRAKLIEAGVYTIQYFEVCNARAVYRAVDHPYMARFTKHTKINQVAAVPTNFPLYACSIVPFQVLRERVGNRDQMSGLMSNSDFHSIISMLYFACTATLNHVFLLQMLLGCLLSARALQSNQQEMEYNHWSMCTLPMAGMIM